MFFVVGKLFGTLVTILPKRINDCTECAIGEIKMGRVCMDHVFAVRQVCKKYVMHLIDVFWAFIDLEKAYDAIDQSTMWKILRI